MAKSNSKFKLSVRHHLVILVLVTVIPVVVFATSLVKYLSEERSHTLEVNLQGTTKALRAAVDEQVISMRSSLRMLSEVEDFGPSRIEYLHTQLKHFVRNHYGWDSISFTDTKGHQVFNTGARYGARLPNLRKEDFFQQTLKTGQTVISGFRLSSVTGNPVISVITPVKRSGMIIYLLIASIDLNSFSRLFGSKNLPKEWTATLLDEEGRILASTNPDLKLGHKAQRALREKTELDGSNIYYNSNNNEKEALGSTSKSKLTGWTLVLAMPDKGHLFSYQKTIEMIVVGGALLLLLSIFFALYLGRKITSPILAISKFAKALGQGQPLGEFQTSLSEIHDVHQALKSAAILRMENEEKIRNLYDRAQEAVSVRETFMSVASHELKTPLTTLKLQFQMLERLMSKKDFLSREELQRPIRRVQDQFGRLVSLVDDLLDVSRITAGKMEYHPEVFDLVSSAREILQQFDEEARRNGILIHLAGADSLIGKWDKHRLEQVIVNLITNGIKYGNGKPIIVSINKVNELAVLEVEDHGLGISEDDIPKVFQKFERVGDRHKASGLGLGLWIVQRIVEGLGGSISVKSILGEGSTFRVELPLLNVQSHSSEVFLLNFNRSNDLAQQTFVE